MQAKIQSASQDSPDANGRQPTELSDALKDLREASGEAREEGFPAPSDVALSNAERLLKAVYEIAPRRFEVYPTPDGEIAIDAPNGDGQSVLLLCEPDGGALCLANLRDVHRSNSYPNADALPDSFLRKSLASLEREGD